ncbi:MAG: heavy metal-binding domain-containing protein [Bacteroidales bacterium]|nr:heavy metal-binding domain-containing protein [Bacteroidales bacterium]
MILTTTPAIEGRTIVEYKGVVFGEVLGENNGMLMVTASGTAVKLA